MERITDLHNDLTGIIVVIVVIVSGLLFVEVREVQDKAKGPPHCLYASDSS